jgi:hypothetical protein
VRSMSSSNRPSDVRLAADVLVTAFDFALARIPAQAIREALNRSTASTLVNVVMRALLIVRTGMSRSR